MHTLQKTDSTRYKKLLPGINIDDRFLINFLSGQSILPRITARQIESDNLIAELIAYKIVIIGPGVNEMGFSFFTPISGNYPMSLLELQGYSLATLIEDRIIIEFSPLYLAIFFLIQGFLSLLLYRWGNRHISFRITLGLIMVTFIMAWLLLFYWFIWIPLFEIILLQLLTYHFTFRYKAIVDEDLLQKALLNVTSRAQERVIPANFFQLEEPWAEVISLVNQTLNLNRLIFLERVKGDHRLKEVKALNCSIDDIHEMRRDYERRPYLTAIEKNGPIVIDIQRRNFLNNQDENELQYLVPLIFADDILGFWAFGVKPEFVAYNALFENLVKDYAAQISELLFYRQRFQQIIKENHSFGRYFGLNNETTSQQLLRQTIELLNKRLDSHESVFKGMKTATILYDLFGRVVQINQTMEKYTQTIGVSAYEMTALEFIKNLTGMELSNVRTIMQHIIIEQKFYNIPLQENDQDNRYLVLNIKPLQSFDNRSMEDFEEQDAVPFQVMGILLELNDLTQMKEELSTKEKMNEHFFFQIRNDMEPLVMGISMLKNKDIPLADKESIIELLDEKISYTAETTKNLHNYYYQDNDILAANKFPLEPMNTLKQVVGSECIREAENKVDIVLDQSKLESLVFAEPNQLKELFVNVILLLFSDAVEGSKIIINLYEQKKFVEIDFKNTGFGMPDAQFQKLLTDSGSSSSEYKKISQLIQQINYWEGKAQASSAIGEGMSFKFHLAKVFM